MIQAFYAIHICLLVGVQADSGVGLWVGVQISEILGLSLVTQNVFHEAIHRKVQPLRFQDPALRIW